MYKYLGNGFLPGIPARNLTDEEAEQYRRRAGFNKLYQKVRTKPVTIKADKGEKQWQEQEHSERPS